MESNNANENMKSFSISVESFLYDDMLLTAQENGLSLNLWANICLQVSHSHVKQTFLEERKQNQEQITLM